MIIARMVGLRKVKKRARKERGEIEKRVIDK